MSSSIQPGVRENNRQTTLLFPTLIQSYIENLQEERQTSLLFPTLIQSYTQLHRKPPGRETNISPLPYTDTELYTVT
jgi:hypothetical protein